MNGCPWAAEPVASDLASGPRSNRSRARAPCPVVLQATRRRWWAATRCSTRLPHIVWVAEPDGSTTYVNDFCAQYTGRPRAVNYRGDGPGSSIPTTPNGPSAVGVAAIRTGADFRTEYRIHRHDGGFRWHGLRAPPCAARTARSTAGLAAPPTSTTRSAWQASLRESERQATEMLSLLNSVDAAAPVGFKLVDRNFRVVRINDRLARANGTAGGRPDRPDGVRGRPAPVEAAGAGLPQALAGETSNNVELTTPSAEAPRHAAALAGQLLPGPVDGEIVGVGIVVVDVTDATRPTSSARP